MVTNIKTLTDKEYFAPGRSGCDGCAAMLMARLVLKTLGEQTIMVSATGCVLSNLTHAGSPRVPHIHSLLPAAGSLISGIDAGLQALGKRDGINLLCLAGDGGTADIGIQALSGAVERGHRFIYICYDNEGYMNTGGQRSGTTPSYASTSTTPVGMAMRQGSKGIRARKDMVFVMAAHRIPYAASASIAFPNDLLNKIQKAARVPGPSYLHILAPCNYRWEFQESMSVMVARLAVQTRVAPLFEVENGRRFVLGMRGQAKRPVQEYLQAQGRFRHLTEEDVQSIQAAVDENWEYLEHLSGMS